MISARVRAVLAGAGFIGLLYWMGQGPRHASSTFENPQAAADFAFPDLAGKTRRFSEFQGKVVLVDFWATWCPPCLEALPELARVHRDFQGRDFILVGVSVDARGREAVAPFVQKHGVPYLILLGEPSQLKGWPIPGFPTSFLVGRDGRVLKRYLGAVPAAELSADISAALAR